MKFGSGAPADSTYSLRLGLNLCPFEVESRTITNAAVLRDAPRAGSHHGTRIVGIRAGHDVRRDALGTARGLHRDAHNSPDSPRSVPKVDCSRKYDGQSTQTSNLPNPRGKYPNSNPGTKGDCAVHKEAGPWP